MYLCDEYLRPPVFTNRTAGDKLAHMALLGSAASPPLQSHVCYSAAVAAWNAQGVGAFSPLVSTLQGYSRPGAPVITSATPSDGVVSLTFTASAVTGGSEVGRDCGLLKIDDDVCVVVHVRPWSLLPLVAVRLQLAPFLLTAIPVQATTASLLSAVSVFSSVPVTAGTLSYSGSITGLVNGQSYAGQCRPLEVLVCCRSVVDMRQLWN